VVNFSVGLFLVDLLLEGEGVVLELEGYFIDDIVVVVVLHNLKEQLLVIKGVHALGKCAKGHEVVRIDAILGSHFRGECLEVEC